MTKQQAEQLLKRITTNDPVAAYQGLPNWASSWVCGKRVKHALDALPPNHRAAAILKMEKVLHELTKEQPQ